MLTPSQPPHTVDALLRVIEVREAEVVLLKLMIDKLMLQLPREVLTRIADHPINRIDELLPWNIGARDEDQRQAA